MSLSGVRGHGRPGAGPGHPKALPVRARANGRLTVAAVGAALVLAACSSGSVPPSPTPSSSLPSSPVATTPSTSPSPVVAKGSLLSGRVGKTDGQVLVVKLDNTPPSEPHAGIKSADVVYIEQVEGGLSRYAVVFSTALPPWVGPTPTPSSSPPALPPAVGRVRSARISDTELPRQYGKVAFAYSGAQSKM